MMHPAEIGNNIVCDRKQQWFLRPYRMRMTQLTCRFSEGAAAIRTCHFQSAGRHKKEIFR